MQKLQVLYNEDANKIVEQSAGKKTKKIDFF